MFCTIFNFQTRSRIQFLDYLTLFIEYLILEMDICYETINLLDFKKR